MHIDSYKFGHMVIDGTPYTADLIIYPDGSILSSWWRQEGHVLRREDIKDLIAQKPEYIVTGTGANGVMAPESALRSVLAEEGVTFKPAPTKEAAEVFNELIEKGCRVGGCFHLTC